jgi:hypothetical protein
MHTTVLDLSSAELEHHRHGWRLEWETQKVGTRLGSTASSVTLSGVEIAVGGDKSSLPTPDRAWIGRSTSGWGPR